MHSLWALVATYVLNALWQMPWTAAAGWAVSRLMSRLGPHAQHVTWVVTYCLSLALPALPAMRIFTGAACVGSAANLAGFSVSIGSGAANFGGTAAGLALPAWAMETLFVLYGLAFAGAAVRLLWLLRRTARLVAESEPVLLAGEHAGAWDRCRRVFGVDGARLLTSSCIPGVVTLGNRLLVPGGFAARCTETEFLSALGHECAHMRRRDSAKHLLYEAAGTLAAFHPVIWMIKAQIAQTREMICDGMVVEKLVEARSYTQSLLHLAERMLRTSAAPVHAIGIFDANALEKRIMRIRARKGQASAPARWALLVCGALVLGAAAGLSMELGTGVEARAAEHAPGDTGKIYRPGPGVTAPRLTYAPDPEFPKAEMKSQGGVCVVALVVDAQGMPQDVHVVRSLKPDFDANAIAAVRQYRFTPGLHKGQPVSVRINVEVNYRRY